jgi:serine/threonine protein kinase
MAAAAGISPGRRSAAQTTRRSRKLTGVDTADQEEFATGSLLQSASLSHHGVMPVSLEQFARHLEESGLVSPETLQGLLSSPDAASDVEGFAKELIRRKKLTKFQADEAYRGRAKSLVLGNYLLLEKIGQGGMGQVFKARHRRMDRIVAVKMLPGDVSKDKAAIARFEREVKAAARISHPNIVSAFDADFANGVHFLVMEYVEGSDLASVVRNQGPLPIARAVDFITQAARGLAAAHAGGIIHRDIKPANLLLDRNGVVKILDMGLARFETATDASTQAELTGTGAVMGTVDYMAPEQALSTKSADARADIYSLGCSLFTLLTGRPTYDGETVTAKLIAHQNKPIPSLRSVRPEIPEALDSLFGKMVQKRVEDRFQTMADVMRAFEKFESPKTRIAAPTATIVADNADILEIAGGTVIEEPTSRSLPKKRTAGRKAARQQKKNHTLLLAGGIGAAVFGIVAGFFALQGGGKPEVVSQRQTTPANLSVSTPAGPSAANAPPTQPNVAAIAQLAKEQPGQPPAGFIALFNGRDLQGWQGTIPLKDMLALPEGERAGRQQKANEIILPHWSVKDGVLLYDGQGDSLQTIAHYRDFELLVDWKIEPGGDSGICLRGYPQVQIVDKPTEGSGGLYNNTKDARIPAKRVDRPAGEWNTFRIVIRGEKVTVFLNGELVVDNVTMENYLDRKQPIPASGPIELQHFKGRLEFRNIYLKVL